MKQASLGAFFEVRCSERAVVAHSGRTKIILCPVPSCGQKFMTHSNLKQHCLWKEGEHAEAYEKLKEKRKKFWDALNSHIGALLAPLASLSLVDTDTEHEEQFER